MLLTRSPVSSLRYPQALRKFFSIDYMNQFQDPTMNDQETLLLAELERQRLTFRPTGPHDYPIGSGAGIGVESERVYSWQAPDPRPGIHDDAYAADFRGSIKVRTKDELPVL